MSGAAILRIKKLKGGGIITVAARHNRRVIQTEIGATGSIDPTRSNLNETLMGPSTADDVGKLAKNLMAAAGVGKLRKDAVTGLEAVFSLPPGHPLDDRAYFTDCTAWAGKYFGGAQNLLSADIHRDEAQVHCHILILPLVNGRMMGSDLLGGKQKLLAMQTAFHEAVASRYGLSKAPARLAGATKQVAAKAVLQKLRDTADAALQSKVWATLRDKIENDPASFLLALGIEPETVKKKLRTMEQIFTSKGKGKANEANPIGFQASAKSRTLCSVGFSPKPFQATTTPAPVDLPVIEPVTVRESELDPALFDPVSGEFFRPPAKPERHQRQAADRWVSAVLNKKGGLA